MSEARELDFENHNHLEDDEIFLDDVDEVEEEDIKFDPNKFNPDLSEDEEI